MSELATPLTDAQVSDWYEQTAPDKPAAPEFKAFPKVPRLFRDMIVTEKLDGTNACVIVDTSGAVYAQSRKRLITPEQDNYGFAAWVADNADKLREGLGEGYHYGEWWGQGIQRGYELDHKRFSLFNVDRYTDEQLELLPDNVGLVPVIVRQTFDIAQVQMALNQLATQGSYATPEYYDNPEGVVVYHTASRQVFKATLDSDGPKGVSA
jgi:hypothetical protein